MDLQEHVITVKANKNPAAAVACVEFAAKVYDDDGKTLLADFTGANAIEFLFRVKGFTVAQHKQLAEKVGVLILRMQVGKA
jgi:hypothetical protein